MGPSRTGPNNAIIRVMNDPTPPNSPPSPPNSNSPRNRLRELLSIPERQRTDAEWDEIIELEITLAPGNRGGGPDISQQSHTGQPVHRRNGGGQQHRQNPGGGQGQGKRQGKNFHRNKPRGNPQR